MKFNLISKIIVIISCLLIVFSLGQKVFSEGEISGLITESYGGETSEADDSVEIIIGTVISVTRTVAAAIALIIIIVIACKYILASAGDRADIKKYAVNYIIGAIILFAASGILGIAQQIVEDALGND